jgi:hypothetical protein
MVIYLLLAGAVRGLSRTQALVEHSRWAFALFLIAAVAQGVLFVSAVGQTPGNFSGFVAIIWTIADWVSRVSAVLAALLLFLDVRKIRK